MTKRLPRIFVPPKAFKEQDLVFLAGKERHYLLDVLRLGQGDRVMVLDGLGSKRPAVIILDRSGKAGLLFEERAQGADTLEQGDKTDIHLILLFGITKGDGPELVIRAGTEIGVAEFLPVFCKRSIPRPEKGRPWPKQRRWERVAIEAAGQCRRDYFPRVHNPVDLASALDSDILGSAPVKICCSLLSKKNIRDVLKAYNGPDRERMVLAVGPEGGFSLREEALMKNKGFDFVSLGPFTLRAKTAGIVAPALLIHDVSGLFENVEERGGE
ncbi:MAG: 16S rRNA (uracil(1498)-N(3))-methyltransferase [Deltaproteobacteria bacterium]|nr:16S rRNA (uracil(1498)-N(3))-methyltransferase [Deltaproteobacteria bacterium]